MNRRKVLLGSGVTISTIVAGCLSDETSTTNENGNGNGNENGNSNGTETTPAGDHGLPAGSDSD